jgi:hypothetical protein
MPVLFSFVLVLFSIIWTFFLLNSQFFLFISCFRLFISHPLSHVIIIYFKGHARKLST